jgi:uncharacterized protein (DUF58 family)
MARWILLGATILGWIVVFTTKSAALLMIGLLLGIVGFFGFVFALAADRVSASARPESSMAAAADLAALRKRPPPTLRQAPAATTVADKSTTDGISASAVGEARLLAPDGPPRRQTN